LIHQQFESQVIQQPEALALEQGDEHLSYAELNTRANHLAHYLLSQGIQPGELIGIYLPRCVDVVVSMLGIMKAGGAYVMLDPTNPLDRLEHSVTQAELSTILSHSALASAFFAQSLCLDDLEFNHLLQQQADSNPDLTLAPSSAAFAYFTSGSTGVPKGALNSHGGVVNNMLAVAKALELNASDRVLQFAALGFDVVIEEVFPALFSGAAVVLRDEEGLLTSEQLQALLTRQEITVCELMASYWGHWVDYLQHQNVQPPRGLRTVILGSLA